ncbi:MAG: hypothetical protein H7Z42_01025 [Roseiflexaceae bacterium]|nr:hypothetical protein [Roseiflexaceae bacterium]
MVSANRVQLTPLRLAIIALTVATALVHFALVFPNPIFILNGLGFLALLGALYLPIPQLARHRRLIRWVLIGYTALTIGIWLAVGWRTPLAYFNKATELLLIVCLLVEGRREKSLGARD